MKASGTTCLIGAAALLLAGLAPLARADMIPMREYIMLDRGMTEAEVLYRVGPCDYKTDQSDYFHDIISTTWYYIPARRSSDGWITEITFDSRGVVQSLNRYRPNP